MIRMTDNIRNQIEALAVVGGMAASDDIDIDEEDFENSVEGWQKCQDARRAAYDAFSPEEKRRWFNAILALMGYDFPDEDDLPYCRSSAHGSSFQQAVKLEAKQKYPTIYAALVLSDAQNKLKNDIFILLNELNY